MDEYTEASSEIKQALRNQEIVVSEQPYSDRWGSFVSGYIPFYDKSGNFSGVLGIDIEAKNYFERLAPIKRATTRTMVAGFFIAFLIASLVWFTRNFGLVVNQKRLDAYERIIAKQSAQIKESHLDGD
jgi:sensor histidine kinase regulating citrate/malate metabolism